MIQVEQTVISQELLAPILLEVLPHPLHLQVFWYLDQTPTKKVFFDEVKEWLLEPLAEIVVGYSAPEDKVKLPAVSICRVSTKRTQWVNFGLTCALINRSQAEMQEYLSNEFATETTISVQSQQPEDSTTRHNLVIRGRFTPKNVETCLRRYIVNFVRCQGCLAWDTRSFRRESMVAS